MSPQRLTSAFQNLQSVLSSAFDDTYGDALEAGEGSERYEELGEQGLTIEQAQELVDAAARLLGLPKGSEGSGHASNFGLAEECEKAARKLRSL